MALLKAHFKFMTGTQGGAREGRWGCLASCPFPFPDDLLALWFLQNSYPDPSPSAADHPPISPANRGSREAPQGNTALPIPHPVAAVKTGLPSSRPRALQFPPPQRESSPPVTPPAFRPSFQGPESREDPHSQHPHPPPQPPLVPSTHHLRDYSTLVLPHKWNIDSLRAASGAQGDSGYN